MRSGKIIVDIDDVKFRFTIPSKKKNGNGKKKSQQNQDN
jgi:hypothetical protein